VPKDIETPSPYIVLQYVRRIPTGVNAALKK